MWALWISIGLIAYVYSLSRSTTYVCKCHCHNLIPADHAQMPPLPPLRSVSTRLLAQLVSSTVFSAVWRLPSSPSLPTCGHGRTPLPSLSRSTPLGTPCALAPRMCLLWWQASLFTPWETRALPFVRSPKSATGAGANVDSKLDSHCRHHVAAVACLCRRSCQPPVRRQCLCGWLHLCRNLGIQRKRMAMGREL